MLAHVIDLVELWVENFLEVGLNQRLHLSVVTYLGAVVLE